VLATQLRVALPLLAPALAGTFAFLMIVGMMVFDVPGIIGMPARQPVLATHIYDLAHHGPLGLPEYGAMCAVAVLTALALLGLCLAYQRLMASRDRFVTVRGKAFKPVPHKLGRAGPWVTAGVVVYLLLAVVLPLGALVWTSLLPFMMPPSGEALAKLTFGNHAAFLADPALGRAVLHSLAIAVAAATAVCLLALGISWVVVRTDAAGRRLIDLLAFLPLAMPGVLIGTALIYVYLLVKIVPVYGTIWIIAIAHVTVYLSFASRAMNAALAQLHSELEEAARMSGADRTRTILRIVVPLALPALGAIWLWVLSHSARELSSALMLQGVNNATVPTLLYSYWTQGQPTRTAAVGVWLALFMIALTFVTEALQRLARRGGG
jgi:iron(III) transport system permease protein